MHGSAIEGGGRCSEGVVHVCKGTTRVSRTVKLGDDGEERLSRP